MSTEAPNSTIYAFSVSHQTADSAVRERLAFSPQECEAIMQDCCDALGAAEISILSTCNRTEFYIFSEHRPALAAWLAEYKKVDIKQISKHLHCHEGREAIRHIFRVACGLDSLILGEPQILGQLKDAHRLAKRAGSVGSTLDRLYQQAFAIAKQVRNATAIGENPVSVAYAGVKLTHQFFDDHHRRTALIIGAGETGQLTARYLKDTNIGRLIIANRTLINAQALAEETGAYAISLDQLHDHLHEADMVFGTARADHILITRDQAKHAMKKRRNSLQVYVDLAMPRNFDQDIEKLGQAFRYGIDDLEQIIDDNVQARKDAAKEAEVMVHLYSDDFIGWLLSKPQQQLVRRIRENANQIRIQLLNEAYRRLSHGEDPAVVLEQMSYKLTNKLLHNPSELVHAIPPDHKDWLAIVADTFNIEQDSNER
ncbi:glutamyl-tRNA reductase [Cardiobacteriaceae bacterium TAE3-ERU3]|nr:glutamyl-tRNA reductase [Cardiobacteriaceae bacterium TAE3-ERU3]